MEKYMKAALKEANKALSKGEVPIGAVVVKDDKIIGRGHNLTESQKDPTAHAEMIAIKKATKKLGGWRLTGATLYVTLEPCSMCAGAIVLSRLDKVVIGTMDPKSGACGSVLNILQQEKLNHRAEIVTGIREQECRELIIDFFRSIRKEKRGQKE